LNFDILNGKYGADSKGGFMFISQAGKSVIDYAVASEGLIDNLVEFKIGNEIISSHMPLLIEIGNVILRNVNTEFIVKQITHIKYRWDERVKLEFLDIMNSNVNEYCMQVIRYFLQKDQINEAYSLFLFSVRRAGARMRCARRMFSRKRHWFDECWEIRMQTRVALRKFKEKDDDISRTEYWAKRKACEKIVGKKRCIWQEKEVEYINKLDCENEIKKIWKAVRKIVRGKVPTACVEPNEWVSHFQDLFSRDSNRGLVELHETEMIGPLYIEELECDFTKMEVKEFTLRMKNNKAAGYDGIPAEFWKVFCNWER
jgi:hypothetical protein